MKSLKLNHKSAQQVLSGTKSATWRLNDEKNLSVNDEVELIDKVDSNNPASWRSIGVATLDKVVSKRLGQVDSAEQQAEFTGDYDIYDALQGYYGKEVGPTTPVKIIQFSFEPYPKPKAMLTQDKRAELHELKLFGDGGSRGNPGPSASGFVLIDNDGNTVYKGSTYLGITTNNQAEYHALKSGLEKAEELGAKVVDVYLDSMLVVNQMKRVYKVKHPDIIPVYQSIVAMLPRFRSVKFTHVPRAMNSAADAMVNEELDKPRS